MSAAIPEKYLDLFSKPAFAHLATLMPDGGPQVTPVWCNLEQDYVWLNTVRSRQKDRNMRRDTRVSLCIMDPDNPYRYVEVRGRVVEITEQGAHDHINRLAKKYLGLEKYPRRPPHGQPGEARVIFKVKPEHTTGKG